MTDARYFTTTKKGEIFEMKADLNSDKKEKKKEAVKKVIASMTVGKDVRYLYTFLQPHVEEMCPFVLCLLCNCTRCF